mmetsp:Transcript_566/g.1662  ORF Transcript_566/g.1662 Transcript_566/m.1662 type:complete len:92 (-) Transcript_566:134-409(-)
MYAHSNEGKLRPPCKEVNASRRACKGACDEEYQGEQQWLVGDLAERSDLRGRFLHALAGMPRRGTELSSVEIVIVSAVRNFRVGGDGASGN